MRYKKKLLSTYHLQDSEESMINLTPLIDVVFVVLISFMIIAPMVESEKISLAPAGNLANKVSEKTKCFKIYVKSDNTIWINNKPVSTQELKQLATTNLTCKKKPIVFHDEKASFGTYQRIKNLLESTGYEEMEIVLSTNEK